MFIDKSVYVYHDLSNSGCLEYCTIFYDNVNNAYIVVPDSDYHDFITNIFCVEQHQLIKQPMYLF